MDQSGNSKSRGKREQLYRPTPDEIRLACRALRAKRKEAKKTEEVEVEEECEIEEEGEWVPLI
jgi:hypothetical protein